MELRRLDVYTLGTKDCPKMSRPKHSPGVVRDAIFDYLDTHAGDATVADIRRGVISRIGNVPASSVRSYLRLRPDSFHRTGRGRYELRREVAPRPVDSNAVATEDSTFAHGRAILYQADCFDWLEAVEDDSVHAIVTDPPYGLVEYSEKEQRKLREGRGGVWRLPPSFDGHKRSPLPRFTTLRATDLENMYAFFKRFGRSVSRVLVPGAHLFVASNPLVSHIVASALAASGLENRGVISRLVMTLRGGDRPKNAHKEFSDVTVMPRSMAEPWLLFRNPLDGRVQDNLRTWGTGGLRRISEHKPFGDVISSHPTRAAEKLVAPHPSLKPQAFLRQIVRAALPLGRGVILDPFAGSGSTLAAANHIGYASIGVEVYSRYVDIARDAIPALEGIKCPGKPSSRAVFECPVCEG